MSRDQQYVLDFIQALSPSLRNAFSGSNSSVNTSTNPSSRSSDTCTNNKIPIDIVNDYSSLTIYAEITGVKNEDLNIDFFNNKVTISVNKIKNYVSEMSEIKFGTFERTITLPICVTKKDKINTSYNNGILCIVIDKLAEEENKFSLKIN